MGGHLHVVAYLLDRGCETVLQGDDSWDFHNDDHKYDNDYDAATPLMLAAYRGDLEIVRSLLEAGATVRHQAMLRDSAMLWAAEEGNLRVLQLLVAFGGDLYEQEEPPNYEAQWAYEKGVRLRPKQLHEYAEEHADVLQWVKNIRSHLQSRFPERPAAWAWYGNFDMVLGPVSHASFAPCTRRLVCSAW